MNTFFEFIAAHWALVLLFAVAFIWLMVEEARHQGLGGARQTPQGITHLMNREGAQVIDLRDVTAFHEGHITGSMNIPYARLSKSLDKIQKYKDSPLILVCAMGQQSTQAMNKLKKQGFSKLYVLGGGLSAWKRASLPLKKER